MAKGYQLQNDDLTISIAPATANGHALTLGQMNTKFPYKSYQATITQTGTSAPSATVYLNEMGTTMTWARTSAGLYTLTAGTATFTANKTIVTMSNPITGLVLYTAVITSTTVITVLTGLAAVVATVLTNVATDALLTNALIEVRVYN